VFNYKYTSGIDQWSLRNCS